MAAVAEHIHRCHDLANVQQALDCLVRRYADLPQFTPVDEPLRKRLDRLLGAGDDRSCLYPGLPKVVQAAGWNRARPPVIGQRMPSRWTLVR